MTARGRPPGGKRPAARGWGSVEADRGAQGLLLRDR
jgi:hypothetical protein